MMLSKLEAGPADVMDRGVHTAALRSHCRKGLGFVEPFVAQRDAQELRRRPGYKERTGSGSGSGTGSGRRHCPAFTERGAEPEPVVKRGGSEVNGRSSRRLDVSNLHMGLSARQCPEQVFVVDHDETTRDRAQAA
jgi:hypothetical protein